MNWWKDLHGRIALNEPLKDKTTFKIGGRASFFIEPLDIQDLRRLILLAKKNKVSLFVLGAGSNVLICDNLLKGAVLRLSSPAFNNIIVKGNRVIAGSGLALIKIVQFSRVNNLSGLEFLAGIPGTLGGALAMNAGAWGKEICDLVEKIKIMDYNGKVRMLNNKEIKFSYRKSSLAKYIILEAQLKLVKEKPDKISRQINKYLLQRKESQDLSFPSAGCIFKNPKLGSAGRLIDLSGLKGRASGGACISRRHANFILNKDNAKACDVLRLIKLAKGRVKKEFNIILKPEIKIWK